MAEAPDRASPTEHKVPARSRNEPTRPHVEISALTNGAIKRSASLLGDQRLQGRGNAPVHAASMLSLQQAFGNRAVQRQLASRCSHAAPPPVGARNPATGTVRPQGISPASASPVDQAIPSPTVQRTHLDPGLVQDLKKEEEAFLKGNPKIEDAEDWMVKKDPPFKYEVGLVYDDKTLKTAKKGTAKSATSNPQVKFEEKDLNPVGERQNQIITHLHPGGAPLSKSDVNVAVGKGGGTGIKEMRAAGKYGTFSISRQKETWGSVDLQAVRDAFADAGAKWKEVCPQDKAKLRPKEGITDGGETYDQDNFMSKHYAMKVLVEKYSDDVQYTHPGEKVLTAAREAKYEARAQTGKDKREGFKPWGDTFGANIKGINMGGKQPGGRIKSYEI